MKSSSASFGMPQSRLESQNFWKNAKAPGPARPAARGLARPSRLSIFPEVLNFYSIKMLSTASEL